MFTSTPKDLKRKETERTYIDTSCSQVCSRTDIQPPEYNAGQPVSLAFSNVFRRVNHDE